MVPVLLALLGILLLAVLVVVYVAFPHRGRQVPNAAWLGRALATGVSRLPTLGDREQTPTGERRGLFEQHR